MLFRKREQKLWFLIILTIGILGKLQAQPIGIRSGYHSLDDGLSDRTVSSITFLEPGFLWIATQNGLNRFEGYEFRVFNNHNPPPYYISESNIREMFVDKEKQLVLSYNNAPFIIDIFDPETAELKTIKLSPSTGARGIPRGLFSDRDRNIFFLTLNEDGIRIFQLLPGGDFKEVLFLAESRQSTNFDVQAIHLMDGTFMINDEEKGLRWFSQDGELLKSFTSGDFGEAGLRHYPSRSHILREDIKGRIWLSFYKMEGLYHWQPLQDTVSLTPEVDMNQEYAYSWEDPEGNLLFAETDGIGFFPNLDHLYLLDIDGEWMDFSFLLKEASKILTVSSSNSFFEDIFLGMDTGLKIVKNQRSKVETILAEDLEEFMRGVVVRGIEEDKDGNIYFAREVDHWYKWDPRNKTLDTLAMVDSLTGRPLQNFNCSFNIQFDNDKEYLWGISCNSNDEGQLHKMNPRTGKVITYTFHFKFRDFTISKNGMIWLLYSSQIGTDGLLYFNPDEGDFVPYFSRQDNPIINSNPHFIMEDSRQKLWIGADNGLFCVDPLDKTEKKYSHEQEEHTSVRLSSSTVYEIHEDEGGRLWLGTTEGINILDPQTDSLTVYDINNGLPNNTVCGFLPDKNGNYWVATYFGLSYFNAKSKNFRNFYKEDGLSHNEFNRFSHHKSADGTFYFGTVNGLNIFESEDLLEDSTASNIFLTKFTVYDRRTDSAEVHFTNLNNRLEFEVSPYVSYFQFDFALSNFVKPGNNRYEAWLEGLEKDYSFLGKANNVRYYKVPAGKYKLHIRGAHANGNWSEPLVVNIIVRKFLFQQTWFIVLGICLAALVAYGIFRYILNQQIKMERLRTKISSDLHDEVSGLLAGIAIQSDILKLKSSDEDNQHKLRQIGEVSRKAIAKMSDVIWSIDSRNDRVEDLLQRMKEHLSEVLEAKDIDYYIETLRINPKAKIPVNVRQDLYLIFKEAINNVAKHSDASEVRVRLSTEGKNFKMTVQDNGSGRKVHTNGQMETKRGQGMANMRMRAHRLKGKLIISDRKGYMINLSIKKFG